MTTPNCPWPQAPTHPVLSGDEVHVWCASLEQNAADYTPLLSPDEQARARRFRFEREQRRFIVGRGLLRVILSRYLNFPPEKLQFKYGEYGKPALETGAHTLCFNLAHSGELALYALTANLEIGIDLEQIHPIPDVQQLAEQFFSPMERAELAALPPDRKLDAFFSGWTRKEAYLKARGDGLIYPLDQFSVSMASEKPARLLSVKDAPEKLSRWSLQSLVPAPAPGFVGALAVENQPRRLVQWQLG
jgi:4'-phosphopantetheinyl transferase